MVSKTYYFIHSLSAWNLLADAYDWKPSVLPEWADVCLSLDSYEYDYGEADIWTSLFELASVGIPINWRKMGEYLETVCEMDLLHKEYWPRLKDAIYEAAAQYDPDMPSEDSQCED